MSVVVVQVPDDGGMSRRAARLAWCRSLPRSPLPLLLLAAVRRLNVSACVRGSTSDA